MKKNRVRSLAPPLVLALALGAALPAPAQDDAEPAAEKRWNVAVLVYPRVELLDFAGPGEVFAASPSFEAYTVGKTREPMLSLGLVEVTPRYTIEDCPRPDIIVVPGGGVPAEDEELQLWVKSHAETGGTVMSVCNGALLLARSGLLADLEVTTHRSAMSSVARAEPTATVLQNRRFVDNGNVITTAGISAGIDGALHLVSRLAGKEEAQRVATYMEYDWRPDEIARLHAEAAVVHASSAKRSGSAGPYRCPPCGMPCDEKRFEEPGSCPNPDCHGLALEPVDG